MLTVIDCLENEIKQPAEIITGYVYIIYNMDNL